MQPLINEPSNFLRAPMPRQTTISMNYCVITKMMKLRMRKRTIGIHSTTFWRSIAKLKSQPSRVLFLGRCRPYTPHRRRFF